MRTSVISDTGKKRLGNDLLLKLFSLNEIPIQFPQRNVDSCDNIRLVENRHHYLSLSFVNRRILTSTF